MMSLRAASVECLARRLESGSRLYVDGSAHQEKHAMNASWKGALSVERSCTR